MLFNKEGWPSANTACFITKGPENTGHYQKEYWKQNTWDLALTQNHPASTAGCAVQFWFPAP